MAKSLENRLEGISQEELIEFTKVYFTATSDEIRDYLRKNPEKKPWFQNVGKGELLFGFAMMASMLFKRDYVGRCLGIVGGVVAEDSLERYKEEARMEMLNEPKEDIHPQPGLIGKLREYISKR